MKKLLSVFLFLTVWLSASAYDFEVDGIYYNTIGNGQVEVTYLDIDNHCYSGKVVIPSSVIYDDSTYRVTAIGDSAFLNSNGLTSVIIPNSVLSIGVMSFRYCTSLTSVTIPDSVTSIKKSAFSGCSSLLSVSIPDGVKSIGANAFYKCCALISVNIPDSLTSVENYVFSGCISLISVNIPDGVTKIGRCAFSDCKILTSVTMSNNITSIGEAAFYNCNNLAFVNMPENVAAIDSFAFYGCRSLTSLTMPDNLASIGKAAFYGCSNLISVNIPDDVTVVEAYTFFGCNSLTIVTIPDGITSIGYAAFRNCSRLTSITIPNSVTFIDNGAFKGCCGLVSVKIGSNVISIGQEVFSECSNLTNITCYATTPPTIESSTFNNYDATLYVPAGCISLYQSANYWKNFFIQPATDFSYTITVNSNDEQMGTTTGGGTYEDSAIVQLIAIPNSGYAFQQWNDGNTDNPRDVILTQDTTFTAYFALLENEQYTLEDQGVYYIGGKVYNSQNLYIKLYYSDGRLISTGTNDIEMSSYPNGIYIVTDGKGGFLKINHYR